MCVKYIHPYIAIICKTKVFKQDYPTYILECRKWRVNNFRGHSQRSSIPIAFAYENETRKSIAKKKGDMQLKFQLLFPLSLSLVMHFLGCRKDFEHFKDSYMNELYVLGINISRTRYTYVCICIYIYYIYVWMYVTGHRTIIKIVRATFYFLLFPNGTFFPFISWNYYACVRERERESDTK